MTDCWQLFRVYVQAVAAVPFWTVTDCQDTVTGLQDHGGIGGASAEERITNLC